jgi:hypothetical protein
VIEPTHAWTNQDGRLRRCAEQRQTVVECRLAVANAAIVGGRRLHRPWTQDRWDGPPSPPPTTADWRRHFVG